MEVAAENVVMMQRGKLFLFIFFLDWIRFSGSTQVGIIVVKAEKPTEYKGEVI